MIAWQYPTLALALVHKALAFYLENQADVDAYMETVSDLLGEQPQIVAELNVGMLREGLAKSTSPLAQV